MIHQPFSGVPFPKLKDKFVENKEEELFEQLEAQIVDRQQCHCINCIKRWLCLRKSGTIIMDIEQFNGY